MWQTGNRIVRSPTLGRDTKPDIFCEWNTKFSIIPEIPSKRVHSKRIPTFSKTLPGIFTVPFNFGPEISDFLVEWKAPQGSIFLSSQPDNSGHKTYSQLTVTVLYEKSKWKVFHTLFPRKPKPLPTSHRPKTT